jgi:hypothetical protein
MNTSQLCEHDDVTENLELLKYIHDSPYFDDRELIQLAKQHANKFVIPSMNCQCPNAKFNELLIYIQHLRSDGLEFDLSARNLNRRRYDSLYEKNEINYINY